MSPERTVEVPPTTAPGCAPSSIGTPLAEANTSYLSRILSFDRIVVAGQAASHCVRFTIDNLLEQTATSHPHLAKNIVLLEDCMSAVTVMDPDEPDQFLVDYSTTVVESFERYRDLGIHVCRSSDSPSTGARSSYSQRNCDLQVRV